MWDKKILKFLIFMWRYFVKSTSHVRETRGRLVHYPAKLVQVKKTDKKNNSTCKDYVNLTENVDEK